MALLSSTRNGGMIKHQDNRSSPLSSASVVAKNDGFIEAEIDNEIVALNIESGTCYGLNPIGSQIWRLISMPIRISDLCMRLQTQYKVDARTCERQVLDLLEELRAEGLIGAPKPEEGLQSRAETSS